ncbi:Oxidoreductase, molybdopterin-binding domain-containing protein [Tricladium varicosporioides]|nr:Oxidoreductase, molybdopterin-binding domain-containing protein [Hymenoscyphus varicosporioides]
MGRSCIAGKSLAPRVEPLWKVVRPPVTVKAPSQARFIHQTVPRASNRSISRQESTSQRLAQLPSFIKSQTKYSIIALVLATPLALWIASPIRTLEAEAPDQASQPKVDEDQPRKYRLEEIKEHGPKSERPWIIRGNGVYDITDWVAAHPGGEIILRASGGSVEPYWKIFTIHQSQAVYEILEQYRIGSVDEQDLVNGEVPTNGIMDPFLHEPERDQRLIVLTQRPCNAETPGEDLTSFLTPNGLFYVRNHMWVPTVEEKAYQLTIELPDGEEKTYSLQDLKKFQQYSVTSTMQCSGNRRKHMTDGSAPTNGLQWTVGAIGNAVWSGARLRDILIDAGFPVDHPPEDAKHAVFTGLEAYGASIPLSKAVDTAGDVILAYSMNGTSLPRDHGYPVRVIVPGNVAARNVKWVQKIAISDEESTSQWQRRDYKSFGPNEGSKPDWSKARSIQEMPVTSAITSFHCLSSDTNLNVNHPPQCQKGDKVVIEGYAYSGGGREIVRVDISANNGQTWDQAKLIEAECKGSKTWCWKRWRYEMSIEEFKKSSIAVKATDESYNTQPETFSQIYNVRGNLATAWHRVKNQDSREA